MNNDKGTIYLIQPAELVGTDRYKIGCSAKNDLERLKKGYKKGTRFIDIRECDNPFAVEREVKSRFNSKFNLIAGKEYFKGDETDIKREFNDTVSKITAEDDEVSDDEVCVACNGSGISYWGDDVYGNCLLCCCIDCGKICSCTTCDKCDRIITASEDNHQCRTYSPSLSSLSSPTANEFELV